MRVAVAVSRAVVAFVCSATLYGCGPAPQRDVLLLTVDTLRPDHLGLYGYERPTSPELDRFFGRGAVFDRAYANAASTPPSVMSLLSGRLPEDHRVRLFHQLSRPDVPLLPELLPERYQTAAFVSNFVLTDEAMGLARAFDHYDDFVDERESDREVYERRASRTTDAVLRWLEASPDRGRPLFLWVHYIDPHGPYAAPAEWPRRFAHESERPFDVERVAWYMRLPGVTDALSYVDGYDEEIAYADREIGRMLEGYDRVRDLRRALVIFAADHGESLMDHSEWFRHSHHVFEEVVRIPLALRGPGVVAGRHETPVSLIDVAPTVLRFVGAEVPDGLDGHDLADMPHEATGRVLFTEAVNPPWQWRAAIQGEQKWMVGLENGRREIRTRRYYDLSEDPGELEGQPWPPRGEAGELLLERVLRDPDPGGLPRGIEWGLRLRGPKIDPRARPEDLERLRGLGYLE